MRVLVIGATGLVGNTLTRAWTRRGCSVTAATFHGRPSADFHRLDMRDAAAVRRMLADAAPEIVAVPAANPHVDYCQAHPEETRRINIDGTLNVARACRAAGARMIFFSSDYVFDGSKNVYDEDDAVSPLNEYGRQKAEAEAAVLAEDSRSLVIRTSGAYGWQREPKNFVLQIRGRLSAGQRMKVANDLRYNPTAVDNLAEVVVDLAERSARGIYHVVGADRVGRDEFARAAARVFGLDESLLEPVPSAELGSATPRPRSSSLSTEKVRRAAPTPLWGVSQGLAHMRATEAAWRLYAESLPAVARSA